jgi:ATP-dependent protease HslVU (ClpYQ) peptidase subunit
MTTIACDGKSMAGDGLTTDNDVVCSRDTVKVRRLGDGRLVGFCGNGFNYGPFQQWLEGGCEGDPPKVIEGLGCMVLTPAGILLSYDEHGRAYVEKDKWAIGSGQRFALAAMDLGKSAAEAVAYAATRDIFTGGVITALSISDNISELSKRAA